VTTTPEQTTTPAAADGMPVVSPAADEHDHAGVHDPKVHHSPEEIRKEIRVYIAVFIGLAFLTGLTVFACYGLKRPPHQTIIIALIIASMKGFLVAGFFMHLLTEKRVIYGILALTVAFFAVLLWLPVHDVADKFGYK
jgi:cytochrome c oxidase subunit IV